MNSDISQPEIQTQTGTILLPQLPFHSEVHNFINQHGNQLAIFIIGIIALSLLKRYNTSRKSSPQPTGGYFIDPKLLVQSDLKERYPSLTATVILRWDGNYTVHCNNNVNQELIVFIDTLLQNSSIGSVEYLTSKHGEGMYRVEVYQNDQISILANQNHGEKHIQLEVYLLPQ